MEPETRLDLSPVVDLLRMVSFAMRPACLALGLLLVSALTAAGRAWDAVAGPVAAPAGLLAGRVHPADLRRAESIRRDVLRRYGIDPGPGPAATAGGSDVEPVSRAAAAAVADTLDRAARQVRETARHRRAVEPAAGGDPATVEEDGLDAADREARRDARLRLALRELDDARPLASFEALGGHTVESFHSVVRGVLGLRPRQAFEAGLDLLVRGPVALWRWHRGFLLGFGLVAAAVVGLVGGTISRLAALQWAAAPNRGLRAAIDYASARFATLVASLLMPLVMIGVAVLVVAALGLLLRLPIVDILAGLLYGPALLLGIVIAILLAGYVAAVGLLIPAVTCDDADAAYAQQRAFAYVLNRPFHLLGYAAVSLIGLCVGYLAVCIVIALALNVTGAAVGATAGEHPVLAVLGGFEVLGDDPQVVRAAPGGTAGWTTWLIRFWQGVVGSFGPAFVVAYLFASATGIYLLLRRSCDGQAIDEVAAISAHR